MVKRFPNRQNSNLAKILRNPSSETKRSYYTYNVRIKDLKFHQKIILGGIAIIASMLYFAINEHKQHKKVSQDLWEARDMIRILKKDLIQFQSKPTDEENKIVTSKIETTFF